MFRRRRARDLTPTETGTIASTLSHWAMLDEGEQRRLGIVATDLLDRCHWEPAKGFRLDDDIRSTIAGHAALLAVGLPGTPFDSVKTIVVHPSTIVMQGQRFGPIAGTIVDTPTRLLGHTTARGPVFISWDVARRQARHPERGHNVIFHEFAHKLDFADGVADGTPPLEGTARQHWIAVCQAEFDAMRAGGGSQMLRDYAATNPGEFFAVVTEVFFDRGQQLKDDRPELYSVLADYYQQDPASRFA